MKPSQMIADKLFIEKLKGGYSIKRSRAYVVYKCDIEIKKARVNEILEELKELENAN